MQEALGFLIVTTIKEYCGQLVCLNLIGEVNTDKISDRRERGSLTLDLFSKTPWFMPTFLKAAKSISSYKGNLEYLPPCDEFPYPVLSTNVGSMNYFAVLFSGKSQIYFYLFNHYFFSLALFLILPISIVGGG